MLAGLSYTYQYGYTLYVGLLVRGIMPVKYIRCLYIKYSEIAKVGSIVQACDQISEQWQINGMMTMTDSLTSDIAQIQYRDPIYILTPKREATF